MEARLRTRKQLKRVEAALPMPASNTEILPLKNILQNKLDFTSILIIFYKFLVDLKNVVLLALYITLKLIENVATRMVETFIGKYLKTIFSKSFLWIFR